MSSPTITFAQTLGDDASPLTAAIRAGLDRPLLLWGHPGIGRAGLVELAATEAGLPFRQMNAEEFEGFDGIRDVTDSGHFRQMTLEKFLARGERADPDAFTLAPGEVLYIRGLNLTPRRLVQSVFEQLVGERMLLNNPLPDDVRIVASVFPSDEHAGRMLLGEHLLAEWQRSSDRAPLQYPVYGLPDNAVEESGHWAVLPSVARFLAWGRRRGLAEEVVRYLEEEAAADPMRASAKLHASLIRESEPLSQLPSARAFTDLGALLAERRLYFSSRAVKDALARATTIGEFQAWLAETLSTWDPDQWIEADSTLTLRGEPVSGGAWLRELSQQFTAGESQLGLDEIATYAAYERRSLEMWASQELGDDLGREFVERTVVSEADTAHLQIAS